MFSERAIKLVIVKINLVLCIHSRLVLKYFIEGLIISLRLGAVFESNKFFRSSFVLDEKNFIKT